MLRVPGTCTSLLVPALLAELAAGSGIGVRGMNAIVRQVTRAWLLLWWLVHWLCWCCCAGAAANVAVAAAAASPQDRWPKLDALLGAECGGAAM